MIVLLTVSVLSLESCYCYYYIGLRYTIILYYVTSAGNPALLYNTIRSHEWTLKLSVYVFPSSLLVLLIDPNSAVFLLNPHTTLYFHSLSN